MLFFAVVKSSVALESSVVTGGIIVIVVFNSVSGCDTVDSSAHGHQMAPHPPSSSGHYQDNQVGINFSFGCNLDYSSLSANSQRQLNKPKSVDLSLLRLEREKISISHKGGIWRGCQVLCLPVQPVKFVHNYHASYRSHLRKAQRLLLCITVYHSQCSCVLQ